MLPEETHILSHLRTNARATLTTISRSTGIPISTVCAKLSQYTQIHIKKSTALLDFSQLGFPIKVGFLIRAQDHAEQDLQTLISQNKAINTASRLSGNFNFYIEALFRDMKSYYEFSDRISSHKAHDQEQFFILEEPKKEEFLTNP